MTRHTFTCRLVTIPDGGRLRIEYGPLEMGRRVGRVPPVHTFTRAARVIIPPPAAMTEAEALAWLAAVRRDAGGLRSNVPTPANAPLVECVARDQPRPVAEAEREPPPTFALETPAPSDAELVNVAGPADWSFVNHTPCYARAAGSRPSTRTPRRR